MGKAMHNYTSSLFIFQGFKSIFIYCRKKWVLTILWNTRKCNFTRKKKQWKSRVPTSGWSSENHTLYLRKKSEYGVLTLNWYLSCKKFNIIPGFYGSQNGIVHLLTNFIVLFLKSRKTFRICVKCITKTDIWLA